MLKNNRYLISRETKTEKLISMMLLPVVLIALLFMFVLLFFIIFVKFNLFSLFLILSVIVTLIYSTKGLLPLLLINDGLIMENYFIFPVGRGRDNLIVELEKIRSLKNRTYWHELCYIVIINSEQGDNRYVVTRDKCSNEINGKKIETIFPFVKHAEYLYIVTENNTFIARGEIFDSEEFISFLKLFNNKLSKSPNIPEL